MGERRPEWPPLSQDDLALMAAYEARSADGTAAPHDVSLRPEQEAELADYLTLEQRVAALEFEPVAPSVRGLILSAAAEQARAPAARPGGLLALLAGLLRPGPLVALVTLAALAVAVSVRMEDRPQPRSAAAASEMVAMAEAPPAAEMPDEAAAAPTTTAPVASPAPRPRRTIETRVAPMDAEAMRAARMAGNSATAKREEAFVPEPEAMASNSIERADRRRKGRTPKKNKAAFALPPPAAPPKLAPPPDEDRQLEAKKPQTDAPRGEAVDQLLERDRAQKRRAEAPVTTRKMVAQDHEAESPKYAPAPPAESGNYAADDSDRQPQVARSAAAQQAKAEPARQPAGARDSASPIDLKNLQEQIRRIARAGKIDKDEARYLKLLTFLRDAARRRGEKGIESWAIGRLAAHQKQVAERASASNKKATAAAKSRSKSGSGQAPAQAAPPPKE